MNNCDYAYIALGSNLGDKKQNFTRAVSELEKNGARLVEASPSYLTAALLLDGSPGDWNIPFLNAVIKIDTDLNPFDLLKLCKKIEAEMGRDFSERWAPRIIDLDILYYKGQNISAEELTIPHKDFYNRNFWQDCLSFIFPEIAKVKYGIGHQPLVMGIINVTPDSFSDGGVYNGENNFQEVFNRWSNGGVHIIDIGAESTRPGSVGITADEEKRRLEFVFDHVRRYRKEKNYFRSLISIDTYHSETAAAAIDSGFDIVNDVSGLQNPAMIELAKSNRKIKFVFMHSLSIPADKKIFIPENKNVVEEMLNWAEKKLEKLEGDGIKKERLFFDFGLGFGKTPTQDLALLQNIETFHMLGVKILAGHSRKSFMKIFTDGDSRDRDVETLGVSLKIYNRADVLRTHTPLEHQRIILTAEHLDSRPLKNL
ncbi:MAG: dihydropteroate synthase [Rickettsiales bacterium]|jgi:2-amino-4-hydroxy-6-hydroxymethyldihydropteridine diphosphokinase/dihydropteroate synthase|nr:dihydropteroate synthase [Rickettsiales bacterium]